MGVVKMSSEAEDTGLFPYESSKQPEVCELKYNHKAKEPEDVEESKPATKLLENVVI